MYGAKHSLKEYKMQSHIHEASETQSKQNLQQTGSTAASSNYQAPFSPVELSKEPLS